MSGRKRSTLLGREDVAVEAMMDRKADDETAKIFAAARTAGLVKAIEQFPDDVINAAQAAAQDRDDMPAITNTQRPWPPMRMRSER